MRRISLILALALLLALACLPAMAEGANLGDPVANFTVQTADGGSFTMSEALKDHDMVLINLWASWCEPCMEELPVLQQAWDAYADYVAVIALSVEPGDTAEVMSEFAQNLGVTLPMGNDESLGLADAFGVMGIPATMVVDRFGNLAFYDEGAQEDPTAFARLFEHFLSEDYTETQPLSDYPLGRPNVAGESEEALTAAANASGGVLVFENDSRDETTWPMLPEDADGRTALASSNAGIDRSVACVYTHVTAAEGDALAFDARVSTERACDALFVSVDGVRVFFLTGERDWETWAVALEPGEHEIGLGYAKDEDDEEEAEGEDRVWVDDVRLTSGEEAAALLAKRPAAPTAEAMQLAANGREVAIDGPQEVIQDWFGDCFWIIPEGDARLQVSIPADIQPELSTWVSYYDGGFHYLSDSLAEDGSGYVLTSEVDRGTDTSAGEGMTYLIFYPSWDVGQDNDFSIMLFASEDTLREALADVAEQEGCELSWSYVDQDSAQAEAGEGTYTVSFLDQHGDPVPGCVVNFCTDTLCTTVAADEAGMAVFTGEPYAYHIQVIQVPEGYSFDTSQQIDAVPEGQVLIVVVEKEA